MILQVLGDLGRRWKNTSSFGVGYSLFIILLSFSSFFSTQAQSLKPMGTFTADTIKIGEPIQYVLTFRYPKELEVVFPDEGANYAPLEYLDRQFFPTRSDSLNSFDSVVYELTTFELDSVQRLTLPVYVVGTDNVGKADSTAIYAPLDSFYLQQVIEQLPDTVELKENTAFLEVPLQFNYPYLLIGLGILLLLLIGAYLLFGDKLRKQWELYRVRRDNKKFMEQFSQAIGTLKNKSDRVQTEAVLVVWKKYMERLDRLPYTKMTTKEIVKLPSGQVLQQDLRAIDRSIYGRHMNGELIGHFEHLQDHTNERFQQRIAAIKHGRRDD